jgi:hypothetical protein
LPYGHQYQYFLNSIRPYKSGFTNRGMLHTRYTCIYDGTYPGTIVKNVYTGDLSYNASQGNYVEKLSSDHICVNTNALNWITCLES